MMLELPAVYVDVTIKLVFSLLTLILTLLLNRGLRHLLKARIKDPAHMHTLYMLVRNTVLAAGGIVILFIWLGSGSNLTVAMGILGAGIAFASQEVIGSFAGYVNIVTGSLFRIGDRVRIGNVEGDVLDISILRTTVMEIGEWVQADQYTGRIVTVANRVVFSDAVFNYTQHWRYLWDEIVIPVTYTSDWRRAGEIMLEYGKTYTSPIQAQARAELQAVLDRYPLHEPAVEPALYVVMTDNWIEMTLRFILEAHERRKIRAQLHHELLQRFESEPNITVASVTMEIVGFPPLQSNDTTHGVPSVS
jgi:small-conductance mechanosensitive channel